ncbi:hypothetical protein CRUP_014890 [Coryphaenoides rupestris]|nr:hypothetical protein CRUP_014890 [Coryphaenoides rupestris]
MYFCSIATVDGTAKQDSDFRGKSQKQVQFNPGQTTAVWRVRILSDGEYEVSESFQIVLSEPVMALLEFPEVANVEILDPGDERRTTLPASSEFSSHSLLYLRYSETDKGARVYSRHCELALGVLSG